MAYLVILQGEPFKDDLHRKMPPKNSKAVLLKAEMARRNAGEEAINEEKLEDEAINPKSWMGLDEGEPLLSTGLFGGAYAAYNDQNYYWYYMDHMTSRMMADVQSRMKGAKKGDPSMREDLIEYIRLLTNEADRSHGRYWTTEGSTDIETFAMNAAAGVQIERNVEFVNALIAPDALMSPLDEVLDFWSDEEMQRGVPQQFNLPFWNENLTTTGQLWETRPFPPVLRNVMTSALE